MDANSDINNQEDADDKSNYESDFDDEDYEFKPFFIEVQEAIGPKVKLYLSSHYGMQLAELEPETYLEIEKALKNGFYEADMIPDLLYQYRTITDPNQFDAALEAYQPRGKIFQWPRPEYWFDKDYSRQEDEDTFLEDSDPNDLDEDQRQAKQIIESINDILDSRVVLVNFIEKGFNIISNDMHEYLAKVASFDLEILTDEGYEKVQESIYFMISELLDQLYGIVENDLRNKE